MSPSLRQLQTRVLSASLRSLLSDPRGTNASYCPMTGRVSARSVSHAVVLTTWTSDFTPTPTLSAGAGRRARWR